jgi:hypothetical protein
MLRYMLAGFSLTGFLLFPPPADDHKRKQQQGKNNIHQDIHGCENHGIFPGGIMGRSLCIYRSHTYIAILHGDLFNAKPSLNMKTNQIGQSDYSSGAPQVGQNLYPVALSNSCPLAHLITCFST